jgi:hypothetical protein
MKDWRRPEAPEGEIDAEESLPDDLRDREEKRHRVRLLVGSEENEGRGNEDQRPTDQPTVAIYLGTRPDLYMR